MSVQEFNDSWFLLKQEAQQLQKPQQTPEEVTANHEQKFNDAKMQHSANINNDSIKNYVTTYLPVMTDARNSLHDLQEDVGELLLAPNAKKVINPVDKAIKSLTDAIRIGRAHLPDTPGDGFEMNGTELGDPGLNNTALGLAENFSMPGSETLDYPSHGDQSSGNITSRSRFQPEKFS